MNRVYCKVVCKNCGIVKAPYLRSDALLIAGDHNVKMHSSAKVAKVFRI